MLYIIVFVLVVYDSGLKVIGRRGYEIVLYSSSD